jgi:hypothetical protein
MRRIAICVAFLMSASALADFAPTPAPVAPDGTSATVDLPTNRHIRNVGGSDGSGLCVFTSVQHSADWQNVRTLDGFREWMRRKPGGGWPEKLDDMLARFCATKGVPVPPYVQHTGGDAEFLEVALKTGRFPCITYAGLDDFYRDRAGRPVKIAHMVNLAHLDGQRAAIIDNNRPGVWVWMTRAELLSRWRDMNGGWAVVLLDSPPPPHRAAAQFEAKPPCICGDSCKCDDGACPGKCPTVFGQCPNGRCGVPVVNPPVYGPGNSAAPPAPAHGPEPIGQPPSDAHEWRQFDDGVWGWRFKVAGRAPQPVAVEATENHGVDPAKIHPAPEYTLNGARVTREQVYAAFGAGKLLDDSSRWHLTAVGDVAFRAKVKADVDAMPAAVRAKLHTQFYGVEEWPVATFGLPTGVSVRKPAVGRKAAETGTIPANEYTAAKLADLCPVKKPEPPKPVEPKQPDATPAPQPKPKQPDVPPAPAPQPNPNNWLAILAAVLLTYFVTRKG